MFYLSFLLPLFPFLIPSFFFFSIILFVLHSLFLSFLDRQQFQFSDNLSDNLAITFC